MPKFGKCMLALAGILFTINHGESAGGVFPLAGGPGIPAKEWEFGFATDPLQEGWVALGAGELFQWQPTEANVQVRWDSSATNSYFAFPLGMALTRADDFTIEFTLDLESIAIGVDPAKPYTFQIAAGLIHLRSAMDPELHRGAGIDPVHGPRNLVEFSYFADSGFGATVAPTIVSRENELLFSGNDPLEMEAGNSYRVEMTFSTVEQTLTTRVWENGEPFGLGNERSLKVLVIGEGFTDFAVDAFAVSSYSDAGQHPDFGGSVLAQARVDDVRIVVRNRPELSLTHSGRPVVRFPTEPGWRYSLERSVDAATWAAAAGPVEGDGNSAELADENAPARMALYRVRAERGNAE